MLESRTSSLFRGILPRHHVNLDARRLTMMNLLKPLTTPEYFFRPRQILHRFRRVLRPPADFETVVLPWGGPIRVRPAEVIGSNIWSYGIFDMLVTEAICRLLDSSELAVDIGANIGQMTNLMRHRSGKGGKVVAFEPHPELFAELKFNVETLAQPIRYASAQLHNLALSNKEGDAFLDLGTAWSTNRGVAKIASSEPNGSHQKVPVKIATLDQVLGEQSVGVCKIDVEGHELLVLRGASSLLGNRCIRDIILEDHDPFPSPVHQCLLGYGFSIFALRFKMWGPRLVPGSSQTSFNEIREGKNYLATLDPGRALQRFKASGWRSLR